MQTAQRVTQFKESVIRDMTRLALKHNAINLSQGFPDFGTEQAVLDAAIQAIQAGLNQYTITWGYPPLREKLADMYTEQLQWPVQADKHVTITCGVTEGIVISLMSILNPGDEIIIFEPAHDNYRPAAIMAGATPIPYPLISPDYRINGKQLAELVTPKTKALLLNTPHNPTGRVFDEAELKAVTDVVLKHDLVLITDEIYDRILYDGRQHIPPGRHPQLKNRTITISGMSKTYSVTGWRLGHVIAPDGLAEGLRSLHDCSTICSPTII
jgi:aminotransferase